MTNLSTAPFSIATIADFENFAISFAKKSKLKPTHVKETIAKVRGYKTITAFKDNLLEHSTVKTTSLTDIFEQFIKAKDLIQSQENIKDNDLEDLAKLLPFFSETCIEDNNYSSATQSTLDAILVCQEAARNYVESNFTSITITSSHYNNDNCGRDHYLNKIIVKGINDTVEIRSITIFDRDSCGWELTREEPIVARLNDQELDDLFFDSVDDFNKLINEEKGVEFYWDNIADPVLLSKANLVIEKNKAAMSLLVQVEDF
jgi:hypothetical protein